MAKNKLEVVNQSYKKALGQILREEFPEHVELVVSDVLIDPSYKHGRVWLKADADILKQVAVRRVEIQSRMKEFVKTRYTPTLTFVLEDDYLNRIDTLYNQLDGHQ